LEPIMRLEVTCREHLGDIMSDLQQRRPSSPPPHRGRNTVIEATPAGQPLRLLPARCATEPRPSHLHHGGRTLTGLPGRRTAEFLVTRTGKYRRGRREHGGRRVRKRSFRIDARSRLEISRKGAKAQSRQGRAKRERSKSLSFKKRSMTSRNVAAFFAFGALS